jgi:hypothetical protein
MKDALAEQLLTKVMSWDAAAVGAELPLLQDLARYKYDEYLQFAPGEQFIESLALWLRQFKPAERKIAYQFVRERLTFCSTAEMRHLVDAAFPCAIRPRILQLAAGQGGLPEYKVKAIANNISYRMLLRQTLFLGLSDGARTDAFRRANPSISNEQIWHAYDYSEAKGADLGRKLRRDLRTLLGREPADEEVKFRLVCLLDDFTASGRTYLRRKAGKNFEGKVATIFERLRDPKSSLAPFIFADQLDVLIVIYVAAAQAITHLEAELVNLAGRNDALALKVVHRLPQQLQLEPGRDDGILALARSDAYFDPQANTEATAVGGVDVRLGFSDGRLPFVLTHNTPNNSIYLLWAEPWHSVRGLFPRVSRHRNFE